MTAPFFVEEGLARKENIRQAVSENGTAHAAHAESGIWACESDRLATSLKIP
jgi:hypothetical protein